MTRHSPFSFLALTLLLTPHLVAVELVSNGDFEDQLPPAWQDGSVGAATSITRSPVYDGSDLDFEVLVEKGTGNGHATLGQTVVIPSVDVDLSVSLKLEVSASPGGPWAAAGLALSYEDGFGEALGRTMILAKTTDCPWVDGDTLHLILAPDGAWNDYGLNVGDELAHLAGVDPLAVRRVEASLFGQAGGDC